MKHALFGAALALLAGAAPALAEMTDIRFTLGWKTQGIRRAVPAGAAARATSRRRA